MRGTSMISGQWCGRGPLQQERVAAVRARSTPGASSRCCNSASPWSSSRGPRCAGAAANHRPSASSRAGRACRDSAPREFAQQRQGLLRCQRGLAEERAGGLQHVGRVPCSEWPDSSRGARQGYPRCGVPPAAGGRARGASHSSVTQPPPTSGQGWQQGGAAASGAGRGAVRAGSRPAHRGGAGGGRDPELIGVTPPPDQHARQAEGCSRRWSKRAGAS